MISSVSEHYAVYAHSIIPKHATCSMLELTVYLLASQHSLYNIHTQHIDIQLTFECHDHSLSTVHPGSMVQDLQ